MTTFPFFPLLTESHESIESHEFPSKKLYFILFYFLRCFRDLLCGSLCAYSEVRPIESSGTYTQVFKGLAWIGGGDPQCGHIAFPTQRASRKPSVMNTANPASLPSASLFGFNLFLYLFIQFLMLYGSQGTAICPPSAVVTKLMTTA